MHIMEFDNFDEAMRGMAEAEREANSKVLPSQRALSYGGYWVMPRPDTGDLIYGRVITKEELHQETPESVADIVQRRSRGYVYGRAYSIECPEGELGDTHVSIVWPVHEAEFEAAMAAGWHSTETPWEYEMLRRCRDEMRAELEARPTQAPYSPQEES